MAPLVARFNRREPGLPYLAGIDARREACAPGVRHRAVDEVAPTQKDRSWGFAARQALEHMLGSLSGVTFSGTVSDSWP